MDEREFEQTLVQLMRRDASADSDAFRESLLERCLEVLDADGGCSPVDDADLDLLSAAGDVSTIFQDLTRPRDRDI